MVEKQSETEQEDATNIRMKETKRGTDKLTNKETKYQIRKKSIFVKLKTK